MGFIPHNTIINDEMKCMYTDSGFNQTLIRNLLTSNSEPLVKILHDSLPNTEDTVNPYEVEAEIYSGGNILPGSVAVFYNTDGSSIFTDVAMSNTGGDMYAGLIPAQPTGTTVYYYIHAEADNGKMSELPLHGPGDPAMFEVVIDTVPPVISHTPITQWLAEFWPAEVVAEITDTLDIQSAMLEFQLNGGSTQQIAMVNTEYNTWTGSFTGSVAQDDVISYRIRAIDSAAAQNEAVLPATGWYDMTISELVDALVLDFDGNTNSGPEIRDSLVALGIETHYMTEMPTLPELYQSIFLCLGVAPNNHTLDAADDVALYDYLTSGRMLYIEGGNFWKDDPRVSLYFEFGIGTTGSGEGDAGTMNGQAGSLADGMSFNYTGDNDSIDRLKIKSGGVAVLQNVSPEYLTMVSKDSTSYKTIAASVEYAGLGGNSVDLLANIADFFGLETTTPPTPTPTPDPGPCDTLGVDITMLTTDIGAGDLVNTVVAACNPGDTTYSDVPLFVILDVYGDMFFYPTFGEFAYTLIELPPGLTEFIILPDFTWPSGVGAAADIFWYAGMTNPEMTDLFGEFASLGFSWH